MAHKGLYKFRWKEQRNFIYDLAVMTVGLAAGVFVVVALLRFAGLMDFGGSTDGGNLHGSAPVRTAISAEAPVPAAVTANNGVNPSQTVSVSVDRSNGYAGVGQKNVSFMKFSLTSSADASLRQVRVDLDGYAHSADVAGVQLYFEGKLAGEVPMSDARAIFGNLDIKLEAKKTHDFEVKADISEKASSGDRVQLGFKDPSAFSVRDDKMDVFGLKVDFPLWGGYISIIGNKIRK